MSQLLVFDRAYEHGPLLVESPQDAKGILEGQLSVEATMKDFVMGRSP